MSVTASSKKEYDMERLFSYALWYTGKFRVSRAKLLEKLLGKSSDVAKIAEVLEQLNPYHSDAIEIRSFVESCLVRSKSLRYVRNALRQKKFIPEDIDAIVSEFEGFDNYENFFATIEKRIEFLIQKGTGPRGIESDLQQKYPQFTEKIHVRCKEIDENVLLENIFRSGKLNMNHGTQTLQGTKKIQDFLLRKGFSYSAVRKILEKSRTDMDFDDTV